MAIDSIPLKEFQSRRARVLRALKDSVGLVFAGGVEPAGHDNWRPHPHFEYLTGIVNEPGAVLMLDPKNPVAARREILFLKPHNPEHEKWEGFRGEINEALRAKLGLETIYRTDALPRWLLIAAKRAKKLACLHPLAAHTQPVSPDLDMFRKVAERVPGTQIIDETELLATMRAKKSRTELAMIERAIEITASAYAELLARLEPGMNEFAVQEMLEHSYRTAGSRGPLYGTIVGGGFNSTVLHYRANDQVLRDGDLVCIDSAAGYGGYTADVTRTFPINGRFSKRQREVYEVVLKAELASIRAVKPGVMLADIDTIARNVIKDAGFGDYFIHSIGHHLGLEVHDITPEGPLAQGAVITIEPGIYIPEENLGVRIEDDILVTKAGHKNLTAVIPKKPDEIESIMAARGRSQSRRRARPTK